MPPPQPLVVGAGPRLRIFDYGGKPQRRDHSHTPKNLPTPEILFLLGFRPLHFVKTQTAFFVNI